MRGATMTSGFLPGDSAMPRFVMLYFTIARYGPSTFSILNSCLYSTIIVSEVVLEFAGNIR